MTYPTIGAGTGMLRVVVPRLIYVAVAVLAGVYTALILEELRGDTPLRAAREQRPYTGPIF